jgi:hypothetical protein
MLPESAQRAVSDLTADQVADLVRSAEQSLGEVQQKIEPLLVRRAQLEARLALLRELASTFGPTAPEPAPRLAVTALPATPASPGKAGQVSSRIQAQVRELLAAHDGPMHTNDIHAEFVKRGWAIPGAGRPNNITTHLTHADGITSPRRGYWALGQRKARPAGASKRRKTRRKKPNAK